MHLKYVKHFVVVLIAMLLSLLTATEASAQYYTAGSDPGGVRWRQIKGDNYSVVFPQGTDSLARRYLFLLEKNRDISNAGLKIQTPDVPVIIHPYAISGLSTAAWGPKRLEIFPTPAASGGLPQEYDEMTALMTNRYLGYMAHYDTHLFHALQHSIIGQHTVALGVGFYPSVWQSVGDAELFVGDVTPFGRGRNGEFLMYYRASFLNGDYREYDNWRYGSYKYYTPDKHAMGYMMMTMLRLFSNNYYGLGETLNCQMRDVWQIFGIYNKGFLEGFYKTPRKAWRQSVAFTTQMWYTDFIHRDKFTFAEPLLQKEERLYTEFRSPVEISGDIYAVKNGMQYPHQLVRIDQEGIQHRVRALASTTSKMVYDGQGSLIWSETVPDIRWGLRSWSVIRSYDTNSGTTSSITRRSRYFNPSVTPDNSRIVAVEYPAEGGSRYAVLDRKNGAPIYTKDAPEGGQLTETAISGDTIYALCTTKEGMGLYSTLLSDPQSGWECVFPAQGSYIQHLSVTPDNKLTFVSDLDGVCNIYTFEPAAKDTACTGLTRIFNSKYGAFYPYVDNDDLLYSDFDHNGWHVSRTPLDSLDSTPADFEKPFRYEVADLLTFQASQHVTPMGEEAQQELKSHIDSLESRPYSKAAHILKIHSWAPFYANINRIENMSYDYIYQLVSLGATVISQNELGTAEMQLGYSYHKGFHSGHLNFNYSGLFPVFELAADLNDRHRARVRANYIATPEPGGKYPLSYNIDTFNTPALDISLKSYIPFDFSRSGWNRGLIPEATVAWANDLYSYTIAGETRSFNGMWDFTYGIRYYSMLERAKRQLSPRLGFGISFQGRSAIGYHNRSGNLYYLYAYGYLPGITQDQNIKVSASFQKQDSWNSGFRFLPNLASMPRGYKKHILTDYAKFTFDYGIFLYLGDVTWPWLYYLHRMQVVPFFDFAIDRSTYYPEKGILVPNQHSILYSYGADVLLGAHILRIGSELNFGVRYARTALGENTFSVIFKTDLK
jgi:hypothetical protein